MTMFKGVAIAWCLTLSIVFCCLFAWSLFNGSTFTRWLFGGAMIVYAVAFVWIATRNFDKDED